MINGSSLRSRVHVPEPQLLSPLSSPGRHRLQPTRVTEQASASVFTGEQRVVVSLPVIGDVDWPSVIGISHTYWNRAPDQGLSRRVPMGQAVHHLLPTDVPDITPE
jgi:hypothetical protein